MLIPIVLYRAEPTVFYKLFDNYGLLGETFRRLAGEILEEIFRENDYGKVLRNLWGKSKQNSGEIFWKKFLNIVKLITKLFIVKFNTESSKIFFKEI